MSALLETKRPRVPETALDFMNTIMASAHISDSILSPFVTTPCWVWDGYVGTSGYGQIGHDYLHRISYGVFIGEVGDSFVCHRCDQPRCVNPRHLFLGDALENALDASRKGRLRHGERSSTGKLTEAIVIEMRRRYVSEYITTYDLAEIYGVGSVSVSKAIRGDSWSHLKEGSEECRAVMSKRQLNVSGRLTPQQVEAVRARRGGGEAYVSIAKDFECHRETIRRACKKETHR